MSNPADAPRWRPQDFRLLPHPEAKAEEPSSDLIEAASILNLMGGAAIGTVGFLAGSPSCLTAESRLEAKPEIGLALGLTASAAWGIITGDLSAGLAGAAGTAVAYAICKFA